MDSLVAGFFTMFNKNYEEALEHDFTTMSLQQQIAFVKHLIKVDAVTMDKNYSETCTVLATNY